MGGNETGAARLAIRPAAADYPGVDFRHVDILRMFCEDTGWTDYKVFKYLI